MLTVAPQSLSSTASANPPPAGGLLVMDQRSHGQRCLPSDAADLPAGGHPRIQGRMAALVSGHLIGTVAMWGLVESVSNAAPARLAHCGS